MNSVENGCWESILTTVCDNRMIMNFSIILNLIRNYRELKQMLVAQMAEQWGVTGRLKM